MLFADKYELCEQLGEGAMGVVYRARHTLLDMDFAVKILRPQYAGDPTFRARFLREARLPHSFVHRRAVTLRDFGIDDSGTPYLTMDLATGRPLSQILRDESRLSPTRATSIACQILEVLEEAHAAGILHRDIKPDNLMVDVVGGQDQIKIMDFGIAKIMEGDASDQDLTRGGAIGTPLYMSPEQASGEKLDGRSDIYSLGVVLFEMIEGQPPFRAANVRALLLKHLTQAPPPLKLTDEVTPELQEILHITLAKAPADRFQSASIFRARLQQYQRGAPYSATLPDTRPAALGIDALLAPAWSSAPGRPDASLAGVSPLAEAAPSPRSLPPFIGHLKPSLEAYSLDPVVRTSAWDLAAPSLESEGARGIEGDGPNSGMSGRGSAFPSAGTAREAVTDSEENPVRSGAPDRLPVRPEGSPAEERMQGPSAVSASGSGKRLKDPGYESANTQYVSTKDREILLNEADGRFEGIRPRLPGSALFQNPSPDRLEHPPFNRADGLRLTEALDVPPGSGGLAAERPEAPLVTRQELLSQSLGGLLVKAILVFGLLLAAATAGWLVWLYRGGPVPPEMRAQMDAHPVLEDALSWLPGLESQEPMAAVEEPAVLPAESEVVKAQAQTPGVKPPQASESRPKPKKAVTAARQASPVAATTSADLCGKLALVDLAPGVTSLFTQRSRLCLKADLPGAASKVEVMGKPAKVEGKRFTAALTLQEGPNEVAVVGILPNRTATQLLDITVDSKPPRLFLESPVDRSDTIRPRTHVVGTVEDETATTVTLNGKSISVKQNRLDFFFVLSRGENVLTFKARDAAGNETVRYVKVLRRTVIMPKDRRDQEDQKGPGEPGDQGGR